MLPDTGVPGSEKLINAAGKKKYSKFGIWFRRIEVLKAFDFSLFTKPENVVEIKACNEIK